MRKVINDYLEGELEVPTEFSSTGEELVSKHIFNLFFQTVVELKSKSEVLDSLLKKYAELNAELTKTVTELTVLNPKEEVNHPTHYNQKSKETIDVIKDTFKPEEYAGFLLGNVVKYLERSNLKGGKIDLKKAEWYFGRYLKDFPNQPRFQTLQEFADHLNSQAS